MKGIIFDLDGTLVDSIPGIAMGVSRACTSLGYADIPEQAVRGMVGKGAWKLCERCLEYLDVPLGTEAIERLEQAFVREYGKCWIDGTVIYPGIDRLLKKLSAAGCRLGVLTNKPHGIAVELVEHVFRDIVKFDIIQGADVEFPRKPDPAGLLHVIDLFEMKRENILYVGDSRTDGETARRAGVACLMVSWGYDDHPVETARLYDALLCHNESELEKALFL